MTAAQDPMDQLPELPLEKFESIGPLERSDHGPFLTIRPQRFEAASASITVPGEQLRVSRMTQRHFAWATYPIVVCHDPGPFVDGLQVAGPRSDGSGSGHHGDELREVAGGVERYRLTAWAGQTLPRPLWCTADYGPWFGEFIEQESCTTGDNVHMWEFFLGGRQDPQMFPDQPPPRLYLSWLGGASDMPEVPGLSIIWGTFVHGKVTYIACKELGFKDPVPPLV